MITEEEAKELCRGWMLGAPRSMALTEERVHYWIRSSQMQRFKRPEAFTPVFLRLLCMAQYIHYNGPIHDWCDKA